MEKSIKAIKGWFVVAYDQSIISCWYKRELPPQLLSRFPIRIRLDYPPEDIEFQIVKQHSSVSHEKDILQGIKLANILRQAAAVEELYYSPSLRETIAFAKILDSV